MLDELCSEFRICDLIYHLKYSVVSKQRNKTNAYYHIASTHVWTLRLSLEQIQVPIVAEFTVAPRLVSMGTRSCCE
jgi:hypothetical protein